MTTDELIIRKGIKSIFIEILLEKIIPIGAFLTFTIIKKGSKFTYIIFTNLELSEKALSN